VTEPGEHFDIRAVHGEQFEAAAFDFLSADEANHTVALSALQGARKARACGESPEAPLGALVHQGSTLVAAALLSRDNWLIALGPDRALEALGRWAACDGAPRFAGYVGAEPAVRAFERGLDMPAHTHLELPLMRLDGQPGQPSPVDGRLRAVDETELPLLCAWHEAFRREARIERTPEQVKEDAARSLRFGTQFFWVDGSGRPVGLVGGALIAPSGARIGPVYTPPALRGCGIGGAMVAALSRRLLDDGARDVFLFTDAGNPTSNALYQRIGFVPIGRHLHRVLSASVAIGR
jgi:RimJ/RimL family protein N-acetyltransferase